MARSRLVFTLGVLASLGAGACGNLLGLDKFADCTESQGLCGEAGAGDGGVPDTFVPDVVQPDVVQPDVVQPDVVQPDADAGPPLPDGSVGSDWAQFRVPNYEGGLVDAAAVADASIGTGTVTGSLVNGASFDGGVYVNLTLSTNEVISTWLRTPKGKIAESFEEARLYCASLGARVPTRIELLMLLDSTQRGTDGGVFMLRPEVRPIDGLVAGHPTAYWTSTAVRAPDAAVDFWVVDFTSGAVKLARSAFLGVLCVPKI